MCVSSQRSAIALVGIHWKMLIMFDGHSHGYVSQIWG